MWWSSNSFLALGFADLLKAAPISLADCESFHSQFLTCVILWTCQKTKNNLQKRYIFFFAISANVTLGGKVNFSPPLGGWKEKQTFYLPLSMKHRIFSLLDIPKIHGKIRWRFALYWDWVASHIYFLIFIDFHKWKFF